MVMIPDIDAPHAELEDAVHEYLQEWVGPQVERRRSSWSWETPQGTVFAVLELPIATTLDSQGQAEQSLELICVLRDLGYSGALAADDALVELERGAELLHARICIGPDPHGSRRSALLLQGTLYLADLQREEFDALLGELSRCRRTAPAPAAAAAADPD